MIELLSPAGNFEKMKSAILYGANAVYLSGTAFGMRAAADNFNLDELKSAVDYAHSKNTKVFITLNTMPRTHEYPQLKEYISLLSTSIIPDAVIISDIGVLSLFHQMAPHIAIHVSTQASTVSAAACSAWHSLGATRIVLARELSLEEIKSIRQNIPDSLELEAFIHGSMCISYSGRCLLSQYFTERDANRGMCTQPCRWDYSFTASVAAHENHADDILTVQQDPSGSFILSSKDLCMIEHIPELLSCGLNSLKIEGRMKSAYYAAVVTNAYRIAINAYQSNPDAYSYNPLWLNELQSVSHREYDTGFFFPPSSNPHTVSSPGYLRDKAFLAVATGSYSSSNYPIFSQRNKLSTNDSVELLTPGQTGKAFTIPFITTPDSTPIPSTPHPSMLFAIPVPFKVSQGDILRQNDTVVTHI